jgi:hypothetical protein
VTASAAAAARARTGKDAAIKSAHAALSKPIRMEKLLLRGLDDEDAGVVCARAKILNNHLLL